MHLIVGLGNPGERYKLTRHNIGFLVVDEILNNLQTTPINKKDFQGELYKSNDLLLLKPLTFMNLSGKSVAAVKNFYKIDLHNIIVIHDDLDLSLGALRFKIGGSSGGHNGLKSIDQMCGQGYVRVRFGIGRPQNKSEVVNFVLSPFSQKELECIEPVIKKAAEATLELTKKPLQEVSSRYSQKGLSC